MKKPVVKGPVDGNAFAVLGAAKRALTFREVAGQQSRHLASQKNRFWSRQRADDGYAPSASATTKGRLW
jgi:hypothetical protein